jgi:hypothetical protein
MLRANFTRDSCYDDWTILKVALLAQLYRFVNAERARVFCAWKTRRACEGFDSDFSCGSNFIDSI